MALTAMGAGALMTGAAGLGQMLGVGRGSRTHTADTQRMFDWKIRTHLESTARGAKEIGIHPLAALGVRPSMGPVLSTGGRRPRQTMQGLHRMGQSLANYGEIKLRQDLLKSQIAKTDAETDAIKTATGPQSNVQASPQGIASPIPGQKAGARAAGWPAGVKYLQSEVPVMADYGYKAGSPAVDQYFWKGRYKTKMATQEASEPMESSWIANIKNTIWDIHEHGSKAASSILEMEKAKKWVLSQHKALGVPERGYEWRYSPIRHGFLHYKKKSPSDTRLIIGIHKWKNNGSLVNPPKKRWSYKDYQRQFFKQRR